MLKPSWKSLETYPFLGIIVFGLYYFLTGEVADTQTPTELLAELHKLGAGDVDVDKLIELSQTMESKADHPYVGIFFATAAAFLNSVNRVLLKWKELDATVKNAQNVLNSNDTIQGSSETRQKNI